MFLSINIHQPSHFQNLNNRYSVYNRLIIFIVKKIRAHLPVISENVNIFTW